MEDIRVDIRRVGLDDIVELRHRVLRQGLPRETAIFEGDCGSEAAHFGAFNGGHLVGCATLHLNQWDNEPAWQLRGMAVAESHRKTGVGRELLRFIESELVAEGRVRLMWCNARVPAAQFYQTLGWRMVSEPFEIPTAGPHVKMLKRID
jgi:GNAT superfamily N-acetyltransferase